MKDRGFSLIELVVVVAIIAVMAAIGTPMLAKWAARNKVKDFAYKLSGDISYAMSVAKKDGKRVSVAIVNAGMSSQNWTNSNIDPLYYLIFEDYNNNGKYDSGEKIISYGKSKGISIKGNNIGKSCMGGSGKCVVFFPVGYPLMGSVPSAVAIISSSYGHIEYDVELKGITGITEVKLIK